MSETIKENSDWYYANVNELVPKYQGKFIAISNRTVLGAYDTFGTGVRAMLTTGHLPGTFIVHHCLTPEQERQAYYIHTNRVDFQTVMS